MYWCIDALIENNIQNIKNKGFTDALTGPVERGDVGTLRRHLNVIPREDLELYRRLSMNLAQLSEKKYGRNYYNLIKKNLEVRK